MLEKYNQTRADNVRDSMPLFPSGSGGANPTSALQLFISECGMRRAQELNATWHSLLPKTFLGNLVGNKCNVAYVAEFGTVAYAVAIWTTPIAANRLRNGWNLLELRRFAICSDAPPNTASRMLSIMTKLIRKKFPEIVGLISYQATDHHRGTIYKAAGWIPTTTSKSQIWHKDESRASMQTTSDKVRWELRWDSVT